MLEEAGARPGRAAETCAGCSAQREVARVLADVAEKRVVIVDTSNEIGGDGDIPHAAIGRARRMQVPDPSQQHRVMIEAGEWPSRATHPLWRVGPALQHTHCSAVLF